MKNLNIFLICAITTISFPLTPASAQVLPPPPEKPTVDNNGVNIISGDIFYTKSEMAIGGDGVGSLNYTRYFTGGVWRDNFTNGLVDQYSTDSDHSVATIGNKSQSFEYGSPTNQNGSSQYNDMYTMPDGTIVYFTHEYAINPPDSNNVGGSIKLADRILAPNGVEYKYYYKEIVVDGYKNSRIQSVVSNAGYQVRFTYESDNITSDTASRAPWRRISKVVMINMAYEYCDPSADSCALTQSWPTSNYSYTFNPSSLSNVFLSIDTLGRQTRVTIDQTSFKIKTPESSVDNIVYSLQTSVVNLCSPYTCLPDASRVTSANVKGEITNYGYSYNSPNKILIVSSSSPLSNTNTYNIYAPTLNLIRFTDALGRSTLYDYGISDNLIKVTYPEGNSVEYTREQGRMNIIRATEHPKLDSNLANILEYYNYSSSCQYQNICNKPDSITDPLGNSTIYTYDITHGGVTSETRPAVNGIAPVKRFNYAQRYAWIKSSSGGYVTASSPIWLRVEERTCRTSATVNGACAGGASDEIVTTNEYGPDSGPNNLLLRGIAVTASGTTLRTCFGYDKFGRKISETKPRAGLATCP